MRQDTSARPQNAALPDTFGLRSGAPQDGRPASKSRTAPAGQSLTAKMLEYRSWWNLPRTKPGKAHP